MTYMSFEIQPERAATTCGFICYPLNDRYCILNGTSEADELKDVDVGEQTERIAQIICRLLDQSSRLTSSLEEERIRSSFWEQLASELSVDAETGLLKGGSQAKIVEHLYTSGLMETYRRSGYKMRILYADIDDLKKHNEGPGNHAQGDLAINTVGKTLSSCFGRSTDIGILEHYPDTEVNNPAEPLGVNARSNDKGDEFIVLSFFKPNDQIRTIKSNDLLSLVEKNMQNMHYEYDNQTYSVSVSFGLVELDIPYSSDDLNSIKLRVDSAMMDFKRSRIKGTTAGFLVDLNNNV